MICIDTPIYGWVFGWKDRLIGDVMSNHVKSNKSLPNQDNSILFEDLLFLETPIHMGGCVDGWMG